MQLFYGGYAFPANAVRSSATLENTHNDLGLIIEQKWTWTISGTLYAEGQAAVVAAQNAMQLALSLPRRDLVFRTDAGAVAMALTNAATISGVQIRNLTFPEGNGGFEYVNGRTFEFTAEAKYPRFANLNLTSFTETVELFGGGPVIGFMRPVNAEPIPVQLYTHSVYEATQSGTAAGLLNYPVPPLPFTTPIERPRIARTWDGKQFVTNWAYRFQSTRPLFGLPTRLL